MCLQPPLFRQYPLRSSLANPGVDRSLYDPLLAKVVTVVSSASAITQFLDRDTDAGFATDVVGPAPATFIDDPSQIEGLLVELDREAERRLES